MKESLIEALSNTKKVTTSVDAIAEVGKKRGGGPRPLKDIMTPEALKLSEEHNLKTLLKLRKEIDKQLANVKAAVRIRRKYEVEKKAAVAKRKRNYHLRKAKEYEEKIDVTEQILNEVEIGQKKIKIKNNDVVIRRRPEERV